MVARLPRHRESWGDRPRARLFFPLPCAGPVGPAGQIPSVGRSSLLKQVFCQGRDRAEDCRPLVQRPAVPTQAAVTGKGVGVKQGLASLLVVIIIIIILE